MHQQYVNGLCGLRALLQPPFAGRSSPDTVIYPMSGLDAATGPLLFPSARLFVGLDRIPFANVPEETTPPLRCPPLRSGAYRIWTDVDDLQERHGAMRLLIGALASAVPAFRLRQVMAILTQKSGETNEVLHYGVISFDCGDATLVQHYCHLQTPLRLDQMATADWQHEWMTGCETTAMIVKASMGLVPYMNFVGYPTSVGQIFLDLLREKHGILVEGSDIGCLWEFSGIGMLPGATAQFEYALPWGYADRVRVTTF